MCPLVTDRWQWWWLVVWSIHMDCKLVVWLWSVLFWSLGLLLFWISLCWVRLALNWWWWWVWLWEREVCWVSLLLFWVCLCFWFLERTWSCLFLCIFCVFVSQEKFWVYRFAGDWVGYCFMGLFIRFTYDLVWFLSFISCFSVFGGD